jgi:phospholipid/cholesterol/gamma-HCH transport system ATP-binding protein
LSPQARRAGEDKNAYEKVTDIMLKIEHLKKHFGNQLVLDDINLEINKGEVVCIIGQSGGGKSVILKHIIGLIIPDGGRILIDGEEISSPTKKSSDFDKVRRRLGMLFQGAALFDSKNVGENIAFPLREHTSYSDEKINEIVAEALEMVGLQQNFKFKMPSELSGGMRSRVGLARALVMKPEIMLYDEPTSALDPIMTDKINDLILSLRDKLKMTSVVVTHDIASAYKIADKMAMIYEGKIIFMGSTAEIRASRNPYIQQFIRGQRKLHYAVGSENEEESALLKTVDISQIKERVTLDRKLRRDKSFDAASRDALTGLMGFQQFSTVLKDEIERSITEHEPMALALFGIDMLKDSGDRFGQKFCETVLKEVGIKIGLSIRGTDSAGRFSSDEFGIILTKTDPLLLQTTVDRIRKRIMEIAIKTPDGDTLHPILSAGAAMCGETNASVDALSKTTGQALDHARLRGGNRVEIAILPKSDE